MYSASATYVRWPMQSLLGTTTHLPEVVLQGTNASLSHTIMQQFPAPQCPSREWLMQPLKVCGALQYEQNDV